MTKKRSRGEGTIYQRPDGLWVAQVTLPSGKRKTKYGKSQKLVRDWLHEQQNSVRQGAWTDGTSLTVKEFLERYQSDIVAHTLRPKTQETYNIFISRYFIPVLGKVRLTTLRPDHLQNLYSEKLTGGYSRRTVGYIHAVIHKALSHAVKWGLVVRNVADAVDVPRSAKKPPMLLTQGQAKTFLNAMKGKPLYALYVTAISTGMRKGEILGLRWADVNLEAGIIHINQVALSVYKQGTILSEPKTEKSRRSIDLPIITVEALRQHKIEQDAIRASRQRWADNDLVFPTKNGTPIGSRNIYMYFQEALEKSGLPKVTFHSLRHLHSTLLLVAGIHPKIVQERLGHSRIDITMDIYSHVIPGMQKPAAATMDKVLGSATTA